MRNEQSRTTCADNLGFTRGDARARFEVSVFDVSDPRGAIPRHLVHRSQLSRSQLSRTSVSRSRSKSVLAARASMRVSRAVVSSCCLELLSRAIAWVLALGHRFEAALLEPSPWSSHLDAVAAQPCPGVALLCLVHSHTSGARVAVAVNPSCDHLCRSERQASSQKRRTSCFSG